MNEKSDLVERVHADLALEPRIDAAHHPIGLAMEDDALVMDGELESVAAKKLALERAAAIPGVDRIVDRLRVAPAKPMDDAELRDAVRNVLLEELAFGEYGLRVSAEGETETARDLPDGRGTIDVEVGDGVVVLNGRLPSLEHKRLAGVLAWWVPGTRDVVNGIAVEPPEADSDAQTTDAVRMALEKDPFVRADQVRVFTRESVVSLEGVVASEAEKRMAEADAWFVFGVSGVVNLLELAELPETPG